MRAWIGFITSLVRLPFTLHRWTCPRCEQVHQLPELRARESAECIRCGTMLIRSANCGGEVALAFTVTGLLLAVPAALLPFVEVSKISIARVSYVFSGVNALWAADMSPLAIWIFLCGLAMPVLLLILLGGVLGPLYLGWTRSGLDPLVRLAHAVERWAMPEVQILAVLVAIAKLGSQVHIRPGPGLWCYAAMTACVMVAWHTFEFYHAPRLSVAEQADGRDAGRTDTRSITADFARCRVRSLALALAAAAMLVPANLLPVISMEAPGNFRTDTIFSGIRGLFSQGLWPLGAIVFTASFLVPLLKLAGLGWLLWATRGPNRVRAIALTRLYALLDFIGRWSMLDVFLVAFLAGAVQFGIFATVEPRAGIVAFAAAVVLTMLATAAFDPHLIWQARSSAEEKEPR